jgi:hypothetical protein
MESGDECDASFTIVHVSFRLRRASLTRVGLQLLVRQTCQQLDVYLLFYVLIFVTC